MPETSCSYFRQIQAWIDGEENLPMCDLPQKKKKKKNHISVKDYRKWSLAVGSVMVRRRLSANKKKEKEKDKKKDEEEEIGRGNQNYF